MLTAMTCSHSARLRSSGRVWLPAPALLTRMSTGPSVSAMVANADSTDPASPVSQLMKVASPPSAPSSRAALSPRCASMSSPATRAPARANAVAVARPIPAPKPVTTASRPSRDHGGTTVMSPPRRSWRPSCVAVPGLEQLTYSVHDVLFAWQHRLQQCRAVRDRSVGRRHPADWLVKVEERFLLDGCRHLSPQGAVPGPPIQDNPPPGAPPRADDALHVERVQRAQVDHLALDVVSRELLGGVRGQDDAVPVGDHGHVRAGPDRSRRADRHQLVWPADLPAHPGQPLVHHEDDRIVDPQR